MGAIINIIINVLLIKRMGLYAASLSTAISYFVMMMYRHYDLKKYINIKLEKGLVIKTILIFIFALVFYYQDNIILQLFSLIIVCIYAYLLNEKLIVAFYKTLKKKLLKR